MGITKTHQTAVKRLFVVKNAQISPRRKIKQIPNLRRITTQTASV